jgi:hypothetical protein
MVIKRFLGLLAVLMFGLTVVNADQLRLRVRVGPGSGGGGGGAEGVNDFYAQQIARAEIAGAENVGYWSLRNQTSIDSARDADCIGDNHWNYVFGSDAYVDPQNAMKAIIPLTHSGTHQLQFSMPATYTTGKLMMTWDFWWGGEFSGGAANTAVKANFQHKVFNLRDYTSSPGIWFEPNHRYNTTVADGDVAKYELRAYGINGSIAAMLGITDTDADPYTPTGLGAELSNTVWAKAYKWHRYWIEVNLDQPGTAFTDWSTHANGGVDIATWPIVDSTAGTPTTVNMTGAHNSPVGEVFKVTITGNATLNGSYTATAVDADTFTIPVTTGAGSSGGTVSRHFHMLSMWVADEDRDPVKVLDRVPTMIRLNPGTGRISRLDFEFNTSSAPASTYLKGQFVTDPPTIASQTLITTQNPHGFVVNDYVFYSQGTTLGSGPWRVVSVPTTTTMTLDAVVSSTASANGDGFYGYAAKPFVGYARNMVILRNLNAVDGDTTIFRKPIG